MFATGEELGGGGAQPLRRLEPRRRAAKSRCWLAAPPRCCSSASAAARMSLTSSPLPSPSSSSAATPRASAISASSSSASVTIPSSPSPVPAAVVGAVVVHRAAAATSAAASARAKAADDRLGRREHVAARRRHGGLDHRGKPPPPPPRSAATSSLPPFSCLSASPVSASRALERSIARVARAQQRAEWGRARLLCALTPSARPRGGDFNDILRRLAHRLAQPMEALPRGACVTLRRWIFRERCAFDECVRDITEYVAGSAGISQKWDRRRCDAPDASAATAGVEAAFMPSLRAGEERPHVYQPSAKGRRAKNGSNGSHSNGSNGSSAAFHAALRARLRRGPRFPVANFRTSRSSRGANPILTTSADVLVGGAASWPASMTKDNWETPKDTWKSQKAEGRSRLDRTGGPLPPLTKQLRGRKEAPADEELEAALARAAPKEGSLGAALLRWATERPEAAHAWQSADAIGAALVEWGAGWRATHPDARVDCDEAISGRERPPRALPADGAPAPVRRDVRASTLE